MKFKRHLFGFVDMLKFKNLVPTRRAAIANASSTPIPSTYRVNETAKALHPYKMNVILRTIEVLSDDTKAYTFADKDGKKLPLFRAGQYVSLKTMINDSVVSRPYTIASSPKDAIKGTITLAVKKVGLVSTHLFDNAKVGDVYEMSEPSGEFYVDSIRDRKNVVAIAGGCGITPFISMAKAVKEKTEDFNLTIIYGARTLKDILFKNELDALVSDTIKVIYVLSEEKLDGYENGFITKDLIEKCTNKESSFFMCGPNAMYNFVEKELKDLGYIKKYIIQEVNCIENVPLDSPAKYKLTVRIRDEVYTVDAMENETLLVAMERAGISAPNKCRAGVCGFCHSKLLGGQYIVCEGKDGRREADLKFGFIHPCGTYPKSDMDIEVPKG